jgi:acetyl esterase/lipase
VRRNAARIKALGQRVRIFVGGEDRLLEANRTFHALLDELGIAHEYVEVPGAGHGYDDKVDRLGLPFFAWFGGASSVPPESSPESSPAMR